MPATEPIAAALLAVRTKIEAAARQADRDPCSVSLLAVSKRKPIEAIEAAYRAGQRDFGENYVQELQQKAAELSHLPEIRWHYIGHLQRNKARHVVADTHLLHGVDSPRLVAELNKRAGAAGRRPAVLAQVNVSAEQSKSGCTPAELSELLTTMHAAEHLEPRGLMTMPPWDDDPEAARGYFIRLRQLRDEHGGPAKLPELSMGMSHDFAVAIAEGATIVRVGTAIFGARQ